MTKPSKHAGGVPSPAPELQRTVTDLARDPGQIWNLPDSVSLAEVLGELADGRATGHILRSVVRELFTGSSLPHSNAVADAIRQSEGRLNHVLGAQSVSSLWWYADRIVDDDWLSRVERAATLAAKNPAEFLAGTGAQAADAVVGAAWAEGLNASPSGESNEPAAVALRLFESVVELATVVAEGHAEAGELSQALDDASHLLRARRVLHGDSSTLALATSLVGYRQAAWPTRHQRARDHDALHTLALHIFEPTQSMSPHDCQAVVVGAARLLMAGTTVRPGGAPRQVTADVLMTLISQLFGVPSQGRDGEAATAIRQAVTTLIPTGSPVPPARNFGRSPELGWSYETIAAGAEPEVSRALRLLAAALQERLPAQRPRPQAAVEGPG